MNVIGINPDAFVHRPDEDYLSATWSNNLDKDPQRGIEASVKMFRTCLSIGKKDGFAIGVVGPIKAACVTFGASIRVVHEPDGINHAHVAVRRIPKDNEELRARLASVEWSQYVLNSAFGP